MSFHAANCCTPPVDASPRTTPSPIAVLTATGMFAAAHRDWPPMKRAMSMTIHPML